MHYQSLPVCTVSQLFIPVSQLFGQLVSNAVFSVTRQGDDNSKEKENIDAVLQYHQNMQEKIADEMVKMAQSLKHTSMMANNIIQQDNKVSTFLKQNCCSLNCAPWSDIGCMVAA